MQFEARIEPLDGKLPKVTYRWDPETDILSVACKGAGKATSFNGTVDLEGNDGSFVVIDVASGCLRGVDVVTWPDDIRTHEQLAAPAPAKDARVVFPTRKAQPAVAAVEVDTPLTVEKNQAESVLHIRVGRQRPATVVRVADRLLVEVDKSSRLAGLRFLDIALSSLTEVGYALRFTHEVGLLSDEAWSTLNDHQSRARFLTWQLYRSLGR